MATLREVKKRIRTVKSTKEISTKLLVTILLLISSGYGFDGNRKGFVLGGGLGFAPSSGWSGNAFNFTSMRVNKFSENRLGIGLNFLVGHAWNVSDMIVFEVNLSGWNSDILAVQTTSGSLERFPTVIQGINGIVWHHYFGASGNSVFTSAGLGMYRFFEDYSSNYFDQKIGGGLILGGGYEFAPHWQIGANVGLGQSNESHGDWTYHNINVLVNVVMY